MHHSLSCKKSAKDLWKMQIFSDSLVGTRSTEWRYLRVADMRDVGVPRIIERSFQHNGLNASTIAPKTYLICANSSDFWISENAYWRIWEYRESMPACPSCIVLFVSERSCWRCLFGS